MDYGAPKLTRGAARRAGFSLGEGGAQLELPDDGPGPPGAVKRFLKCPQCFPQ